MTSQDLPAIPDDIIGCHDVFFGDPGKDVVSLYIMDNVNNKKCESRLVMIFFCINRSIFLDILGPIFILTA